MNLVFERDERPTAFTAHYGVTAAPEAATYALVAAGLAALARAAISATPGPPPAAG